MNRQRQSVIIILFVSLVWTVATLAAATGRSGVPSVVPAPTPAAGRKRPRSFKLIDHTCESGCNDTYESTDGKEVTFTFACYTGTAPEARREIRRMLAEGTVVATSRRIGKNRRSERTLLLHPLAEDKRAATIIWYRRGDICFSYIEAESLKLALEFERSQSAVEHLSSYRGRSH